ncbi:MAG: DUF2490 domain-containing protein [Bacteroidota bacterium]
MKKRYVYLLLIFLFSVDIHGQNEYQLGFLPKFNLNKSLSQGLTLNLKLESRQSLRSGTFGVGNGWLYDYKLSDFAAVLSKRSGVRSSFAGGIQFRKRNDQWVYRLIQQFSLVQKYTLFRLGHRFGLDQTFVEGSSPSLRFRYRITAEFPISGQQVDRGEFYLKIGNEYLPKLQNSNRSIEVRLLPILGINFTDNNKLEFGLDYRLDRLTDPGFRQSYWMVGAWYLKL